MSIQYGWYNADLPAATHLGNAIIGACLFGGSNVGASNLVGGMAGHGAEVFSSNSSAYVFDTTHQRGLGAVYVGNLGNGGFGGQTPITTCAESSLENGGANPKTTNDAMMAEEVSGLGCPLIIDVQVNLPPTAFGSGTNNIQLPALTTTANGDYIWAAVQRTDGSTTLTPGTNVPWAAGAKTGSAIGAATEHFIQSAAGSIQPQFTGTAGTYIGVAIAFKAGGGCNTNNTNMILQSRQLIDSTQLTNSAPKPVHILNGNLFVVGVNGNATQAITVSDNKSNAYVAVTGPNITGGFAWNHEPNNGLGGADYAGFMYASGGIPGVTAIAINFGSSPWVSAYVYDFLNAATSNVFDAACGGYGDQESGLADINPCNVTTTGNNEWLLSDLVQWFDCTEGVASPWTFGPQDQNNGTADRFAPAAGTYGSTYVERICGPPYPDGIGPWAGVIAAFRSSTGAPPPPNLCDLNGDGAANAADLQSLVNAILGGSTSSIFDLNKDGGVNSVDAQLLVNVVLGVIPCP